MEREIVTGMTADELADLVIDEFQVPERITNADGEPLGIAIGEMAEKSGRGRSWCQRQLEAMVKKGVLQPPVNHRKLDGSNRVEGVYYPVGVEV